MELVNTINKLKPQIIKDVSIVLTSIGSNIDNYTIAWEQLQYISSSKLINLLKDRLTENCIISSPTSKSTYPDIKIETEYGNYAIDIKANERSKEPWFDMGRLDTLKEKRLDKYIEEWKLVIKYDSIKNKFVKAYFLLFREAVGIREECQGLKYRPYDGKIRPKNWVDFENEKVYWNTKNDFLGGLRKSILNRWENNIKKHLISQLSKDEKNQFRNLFDE